MLLMSVGLQYMYIFEKVLLESVFANIQVAAKNTSLPSCHLNEGQEGRVTSK